MNKETLATRVKEITLAAEQALANYHGLLGRLSEAKFILENKEQEADNHQEAPPCS